MKNNRDPRFDALTMKAGTVGGITGQERDEWHRLLCEAASQYGTTDDWTCVLSGYDYGKAPAYLDATAYPRAKPHPLNRKLP